MAYAMGQHKAAAMDVLMAVSKVDVVEILMAVWTDFLMVVL